MKSFNMFLLLLVSLSSMIHAETFRIGIQGGGLIPVVSEPPEEYKLTSFLGPFGEVTISSELRLAVSVCWTSIDEENNWWAEQHRQNHTYDYEYTANEKTLCVQLIDFLGSTFFGLGVCYVTRGFTAETTEYGDEYYYDRYRENDTGFLISTGYSIQNRLDVLMQGRFYNGKEIWLVLGAALGFNF